MIFYKTKKLPQAIRLAGALFFLVFANLSFADGDDDDDEGREDGKIEINEQQMKYANITLGTVSSGKVRELLPVYGKIIANPENEQMISARYQGVVKKLSKSIGDSVKNGEPLITIEANESLRRYSIKSELNAVVVARNINLGEQTGDKVLYKLQDFSSVWVELSIFPKDIDKVTKQNSVRVSSVDGSLVTEGKILTIAPFSQQKNQAVKVIVLIQNPKGVWKPGHFVNADVILSENEVGVSVSSEAIQIINGRPTIFVREAELFEPRPIRVGLTDGDITEVLSGVESGEQYAIKNSFVLKSELGKGEIEDDD